MNNEDVNETAILKSGHLGHAVLCVGPNCGNYFLNVNASAVTNTHESSFFKRSLLTSG